MIHTKCKGEKNVKKDVQISDSHNWMDKDNAIMERERTRQEDQVVLFHPGLDGG